jgi:predicted heme/steroid binding protein
MPESSLKKLAIDRAEVQKILSSVSYENGFHFFTGIGKYTGETAISLFSFFEELRTIDLSSVRFHFGRRDFQNWIKGTLGDKELEARIDKIKAELSDGHLKEELIKIVQTRFVELQTLSNMQKEQKTTGISGEELKKFSIEELRQYDGQGGKPVYVAFNGKVYDVSSSGSWSGGTHKVIHQAGKDLTVDILSAPHGEEVFAKVKQVGVLVQ